MRRFVHKSTVVLIAVCTLAILYAWNAKADQALDQPPTSPKFRLPSHEVGPVRYRLDLTVVPDQDTFMGTVEIDLQFAKSTSVLWLNGERLTVKDATLTVGHEKLAAKVISEPQDYVGFAFDHPVGPGDATLRVVYQGEISRKDQQGIFQMKDGDRWYVYSQFEAIWARRAFPCFDEPSYKVPWQLTLRVKKDQVALSNAPMVSETDSGDGMKVVKFAETKPLPSYLVALAVGDLEFVDAGTTGKKNTRVRIVVPRGRGSGSEIRRRNDSCHRQLAGELLRYSLSLRQARRSRHSAFRRGHGECGFRDLWNRHHSRQTRSRHPVAPARMGMGGCPRTGSSMVRRPRDHCLVG